MHGVGGAFCVATTAGCFWYFGKGAYLSPRGSRLSGALCLVRDRATLFGGTIAIWSFLFNFSRGVTSYIRQADDKWSACIGGFTAGLFANIRGSLAMGFTQGLNYAFTLYVLYTLSEKS